MLRRAWWCGWVVVLAGLADAAQGEDVVHRGHPELAQRLAAIRVVVVVPPDLKAYELMRNDQPVFHGDWTDRARENVATALERRFGEGQRTVRRLEVTSANDAAVQDVAAMYRAVASAIFQATVAHTFIAQRDRFDYTMGDLSALAPDGEAFVLLWGRGVTSSGARKVLTVFEGTYALDRLVVALVDRRGEVLWFGSIASHSYDLREPGSAAECVGEVLSSLPREAR